MLQTFVELESEQAIDKAGRWSNLSGRAGYYSYVARVVVRHGRLERGDELSLVYGDTSGGSRGFRAGINVMDASPCSSRSTTTVMAGSGSTMTDPP